MHWDAAKLPTLVSVMERVDSLLAEGERFLAGVIITTGLGFHG